MLSIGPAHQPFGASIDDLVPVLVDTTTSIHQAIQRATALVEDLPNQVQRGVEATAYSAGKGFARGFGWNILLPMGIATGVVLGGVLIFKLVESKAVPARRRKLAFVR